MAKSLVRIANAAKDASNSAYGLAIREFVKKMGGPWAVMAAITEEVKQDNTLFDNTRTEMPIRPDEDEEENIDQESEPFARCM